MGRIVIPPELGKIFDKPGKRWGLHEIEDVTSWLFESSQYRYLLYVASHNLNRGVKPADAEDALGNFIAYELDGVIRTYAPTKGQFWPFLLHCFRRSCWRWAKATKPNYSRGEPLFEAVSADSDNCTEGELASEVESPDPDQMVLRGEKAVYRETPLDSDPPDPNPNPLEVLERSESQDTVERSLDKLRSEDRDVIHRYYFQGTRDKEIARSLAISKNTAKQRRFRALRRLSGDPRLSRLWKEGD